MTIPERPTEPERPAEAWPASAAPVEPASPDTFESGTVPVAARLPITQARKAAGPSSRVVNLILGLAAIVAIGGLAFAAGRMTAPTTAATNGNGPGNGRFGNGQFPGGENGVPGGGNFTGGAGFLNGSTVLQGTVVSSTSTSLTLELGAGTNGRTIQIEIPISSSTTVHSQAAATTGDIAAGQKVLVQLGTAAARATQAPVASGAPREVQAPASDITIVSP
jgi:hypothetical protein